MARWCVFVTCRVRLRTRSTCSQYSSSSMSGRRRRRLRKSAAGILRMRQAERARTLAERARPSVEAITPTTAPASRVRNTTVSPSGASWITSRTPSRRSTTESPGSPSFQRRLPAPRRVSVPRRESSGKKGLRPRSDTVTYSSGSRLRAWGHITVDDLLDGAAADRAEPHLVASEHDAVRLRAVLSLRLVLRPFEGSHVVPVGRRGQHGGGQAELLTEQGLHLYLGTLVRAKL